MSNKLSDMKPRLDNATAKRIEAQLQYDLIKKDRIALENLMATRKAKNIKMMQEYC